MASLDDDEKPQKDNLLDYVQRESDSLCDDKNQENKENLFEDEKKPLWTLYQTSTFPLHSTSKVAPKMETDHCITLLSSDEDDSVVILSQSPSPSSNKSTSILASVQQIGQEIQDSKTDLKLKSEMTDLIEGEQENKKNLIFDDEKKPLWTLSRTSCITLSSDEDDSVVVIPLSPPAKISTSLLGMFNSTEMESDVADPRVKLVPKRKKAETAMDNRTSNATVPKIDTDLCITVFSDEDDPVPSSSKPYVPFPPPPQRSVRIPPLLPRSVAIPPSPSTNISTSLLEMFNSTDMIEPNVPNTKVKYVPKRKTKKVEEDEVVRSPRKGRVLPKVNNKRKINAITKTSDTEDSMGATTGMADFEGALVTRKKLRDSFEISKQSFDAEQAERSRAIRLIKKEEILREEIPVNLPDLEQGIILDIDRDNKEILAEVDRRFVAILKKHQVDGVRFMFDCTIESIRRFEDVEKEKCEIKNGTSFGGILAHCMGLGKTLQVIVFLNTILNNPVTSKRINKVLIIVPLNVIKNWESEFDCWFHRCKLKRSFGLFELYTIKGGKKRSEMLLKWRQKGGVMLITAGLFVELFMGDKPYGDTFDKCLLNPGPDMVIIDEGHMLKNDETCLNSVASRIATVRRIILTGTPLQNNLIEYF